MKCPTCKDPELVMSERQGIEIDYCPSCRGVWLDRGELDKIIERAAQYEAEQAAAPPQSYQGGPPQSYPRGERRDDYYKHHKKRKPFWMELFD